MDELFVATIYSLLLFILGWLAGVTYSLFTCGVM